MCNFDDAVKCSENLQALLSCMHADLICPSKKMLIIVSRNAKCTSYCLLSFMLSIKLRPVILYVHSTAVYHMIRPRAKSLALAAS